jgi:hypothetical protein
VECLPRVSAVGLCARREGLPGCATRFSLELILGVRRAAGARTGTRGAGTAAPEGTA